MRLTHIPHKILIYSLNIFWILRVKIALLSLTANPIIYSTLPPLTSGEPPNTTTSTTSSGYPDFDDVVRVGGLPSPSVFAHPTPTPTLSHSQNHSHNNNNNNNNPTPDAFPHFNSTSNPLLHPHPSAHRDAFDLIESCLHNPHPDSNPTAEGDNI